MKKEPSTRGVDEEGEESDHSTAMGDGNGGVTTPDTQDGTSANVTPLHASSHFKSCHVCGFVFDTTEQLGDVLYESHLLLAHPPADPMDRSDELNGGLKRKRQGLGRSEENDDGDKNGDADGNGDDGGNGGRGEGGLNDCRGGDAERKRKKKGTENGDAFYWSESDVMDDSDTDDYDLDEDLATNGKKKTQKKGKKGFKNASDDDVAEVMLPPKRRRSIKQPFDL